MKENGSFDRFFLITDRLLNFMLNSEQSKKFCITEFRQLPFSRFLFFILYGFPEEGPPLSSPQRCHPERNGFRNLRPEYVFRR